MVTIANESLETDALKTDTPSPKLTRYQVYMLGVLLLVVICNYVDRSVLSLLQEDIKRDLHLTDTQLGLLGGPIFALFFAVCGIPVARLAERTNRARLLAGCVSFWSLMTALCGLATNFITLGFARMGVGAGEGGCIPLTQSMLADTFTARQRGKIMSFIATATPIAGIITPLLVPPIAAMWGWRGPFIALGIPGILLGLLVAGTIKEPKSERSRPVEAGDQKRSTFRVDVGWLLRNRTFVLMFFAGAFIGIGVTSLGQFRVSFLLRVHDFTLAQAGTIFAIGGVVGLIGTIAGGVLADKFSGKSGRSYILIPAVGCGLTWFIYLGAFNTNNAILCAVLLIATQFSYSLKTGPMYAAIQNIVPSHMRTTGAAMHMLGATTVGGFVGPPLAGALSDLFANRAFPDALGASYHAVCPGGRPPGGAAQSLAEACMMASSDGLQHAMSAMSFIYLAAGLMLFLASRSLRHLPE